MSSIRLPITGKYQQYFANLPPESSAWLWRTTTEGMYWTSHIYNEWVLIFTSDSKFGSGELRDIYDNRTVNYLISLYVKF
jgi:hypothetical protein